MYMADCNAYLDHRNRSTNKDNDLIVYYYGHEKCKEKPFLDRSEGSLSDSLYHFGQRSFCI